ncbi:Wadjet anti-phage system protein JetD domain-containing protein [Clostridium sp. Cult2]|uniref:Wadjet anti-phage system protein JetD domain-containing protein n=1 Tax=Clostridium sp. Cult2 TaxID=2079003 RepID=UPI001F3BF84F|nr:cytosolic protein [Clostridium sp. Cult2]
MYKDIVKFIKIYTNTNNRKRFELEELENHLIHIYKGKSGYEKNGGYRGLYNGLTKAVEEGIVKEIISSDYNGMNPPLRVKWRIITQEKIGKWDKSEMMKMSDLLDFGYYERHLECQNEMEWKYIKNIYNFLKTIDNREWASLEERSLELFYDEKFLYSRRKRKIDNKVLTRLNITYEDLKMKKYGEMFIYWKRGIENIEKVIILENHSTFFSYKRACESGIDIFGVVPDLLIFGQGKKIINSFSFIEELVSPFKLEILYFGDIDPEGFMIYRSFKRKYSNLNIKLHLKAFIQLLEIANKHPCIGQNKNILDLNFVLSELASHSLENYGEVLKELWTKDLRIPQEYITYEYILKGDKFGSN